MKLFAFCIYDAATAAFMRPFFCHTEQQAIRMFKDCVYDENHECGKHPEDYSIHRVGLFDDQNGHFEAVTPVQVVTGNELMGELVRPSENSFERQFDPESVRTPNAVHKAAAATPIGAPLLSKDAGGESNGA